MKKLYSMEAAKGWLKKARQRKYIMLGVGILSLAVCIFLCTQVTFFNQDRLLWPVVVVSVLGGWGVIVLYSYAYAPARARAEHMKGIMAGEEEVFSGVLQRTGESFSIPKSVTVKKIRLQMGEESVLLHAESAAARQLPADGTRVQVSTVRKFITGYEVLQ